MIETRPFFIVSSGRSGTQMMTKIFEQFPNTEIHHEYMVNIIQPLAAQYYMGLVSKEFVCEKLKETHKQSIFYSEKEVWGDSSNKLSWIIDCLNEVFPNAKFIHIVRDGRKVVSSFFNKLSNECYDDRSVQILRNWVERPNEFPKPPPEKKYWWNIPIKNYKESDDFKKYDQFERICFHWKEVNSRIFDSLKHVEDKRKKFFKLEDLVMDSKKIKELLEFLELDYDKSILELLKKPHNVNIPKDFQLNEEQKKQFVKIAGTMMDTLGYDISREYSVNYHGNTPIGYD